MGSIAEGRIRGELAVAKFVVATLRDVEGDGSAPRNNPLALTIAQRVDLGVTTTTPIVRLGTMEVHMRREDTGEGGKTGWTVSPFLVRARLH